MVAQGEVHGKNVGFLRECSKMGAVFLSVTRQTREYHPWAGLRT